MNTSTQSLNVGNTQSALKLGLDVDLKQITATIQHDHRHPVPASSFTLARLLGWVRHQVAAGHTGHTVYESCGFGFTLHDQLLEADVGCGDLVSRFLHVLHKTIRQAIAEILPMKKLCDIRKHMNMVLELARRHQKQKHQMDWLTVEGVKLNSLPGTPNHRHQFRYEFRGGMGKA